MTPEAPYSSNQDRRGAVTLLVLLIGSCVGTFLGVYSFLLLNSWRTRITQITARSSSSDDVQLARNLLAQAVKISVLLSESPRVKQTLTTMPLATPQTGIAHITDPIRDAILRISNSLLKIRLYRIYGWAIIPLLVVFTLQLNNHMYYNLFFGYDMPQHANNTFSIMNTGMMPPPPLSNNTYEAHQAPLFYIMAAWVMLLGRPFVEDAWNSFMSLFLLLWAIAWAIAVVLFVQNAMRRVRPILRGLTVCVVLLFPMNTIITVMFSNDIAVIPLGAIGATILWYMTRSGRQLDPGMWLRASTVIALAIAFKSNAISLLGCYLALAAYIALTYLLGGNFRKAVRLVVIAGIGIPMMVVPYILNTYHALRYVDNPFGSINKSIPHPFLQDVKATFFTTFDTELFNGPFAWPGGSGPGDQSFWSRQFVTLHSDFYNHWNSDAYVKRPTELMMPPQHRQAMPIEHWNDAIILQYLAIPISLVIVFGFCYSLYRVIWKRKYVLRDGSVVVVLFTLVTEAAQIVRFGFDSDVSTVIARYIGFLYAFLFIIGILSLWKVLHRRGSFGVDVLLFMSACMAGYVFMAMKFMWLPPI